MRLACIAWVLLVIGIVQADQNSPVKKDTLAIITENNKITVITNIDTTTRIIGDTASIVNFAPQCYPPCRPGYFCRNGRCVSM